MTTSKVTKANATAWLQPFTQPRSVLVFPNPSSRFESWICDESAAQKASEVGEIIVCDSSHAAYAAGAEILKA